MKPSAIRIERMLEKIEARLVPPPRKCLRVVIHEGDDEAAAKQKALAEHIAARSEDAGRTVKDFNWVVHEIVHPKFIIGADGSVRWPDETIEEGEFEDTGGPQKYTGRSMKESHQHLMITATEWEAFLDDLQQTLDKFAVPPAEQAEIKAIVASTRADIVI